MRVRITTSIVALAWLLAGETSVVSAQGAVGFSPGSPQFTGAPNPRWFQSTMTFTSNAGYCIDEVKQECCRVSTFGGLRFLTPVNMGNNKPGFGVFNGTWPYGGGITTGPGTYCVRATGTFKTWPGGVLQAPISTESPDATVP
jgi:hypothetical protein